MEVRMSFTLLDKYLSKRENKLHGKKKKKILHDKPSGLNQVRTAPVSSGHRRSTVQNGLTLLWGTLCLFRSSRRYNGLIEFGL